MANDHTGHTATRTIVNGWQADKYRDTERNTQLQYVPPVEPKEGNAYDSRPTRKATN